MPPPRISTSDEKKGHVCPKPTARHPADRWETMFVYSFICKFTNLRTKVDGLDSPMDLEAALVSREEANPVLQPILSRFMLNLRPQTRNLSSDQISSTIASLLLEFGKTSERLVFWSDTLKRNVDPFEGLEGTIFTADWDFKLQILRQLVELQLTHSTEIKGIIDRAWGVTQYKIKKKEAQSQLTDSQTQENLQVVPIGQDRSRKRYWVADNSPRVYVSTNPWKTTATFESLSSTREEYDTTIETLKSFAPEQKGKKMSKIESSHLALINTLESREEMIDAELTRLARARKRLEQKMILLAQAELRSTRTRRQTRKPDYVYNNDNDSEDDGDAYSYQEDDELPEEEFTDDTGVSAGRRSRRAAASTGQRRSTRMAVVNANGKRAAPDDDSNQWRGERRSLRLGALPDTQLDEEQYRGKRARTEDSMTSASSTAEQTPLPLSSATTEPGSVKGLSAASVRPTETAVEHVTGRKKSKFWFYAVEPVAGTAPIDETTTANGNDTNGVESNSKSDAMDVEEQVPQRWPTHDVPVYVDKLSLA